VPDPQPRPLADLLADDLAQRLGRQPAPQPRPAHAPELGPERARTATVALRGAAAAYPNRPGPVLRDLDLELAPGRPVALAGPRGSGKTLVVLTLLRFLDLTAGNLSIDGTDARACSPGEVRALLAWSPEQPTLFPTSLRAGLRVGAPHATDRQITDLLRQLRLGPWLDRLEQGLDTVLAPWDHPVSGGELQRLSLSRAVLADRPVLLLDEPTRHLDAATADAVLQAVLERAADRSLLWITHRPEELAAFPEVHHLGADPLSASDRPPDLWLRGPVPESAHAGWEAQASVARVGSMPRRGSRKMAIHIDAAITSTAARTATIATPNGSLPAPRPGLAGSGAPAPARRSSWQAQPNHGSGWPVSPGRLGHAVAGRC